MDFDIGNILYVVITLVAIIVSLLGKKKKPGVKESKPGFLENLDKVLRMGQEDPSLITMQDFEPDMEEESDMPYAGLVPEVSEMANEAPSLMEEYELLLKNRGGSPVEAMHYEGESATKPLEVVDLDDEGGTNYFDIVRDFDAGTAVVYSAIINRVDY
jgi:hypothetical protein